MYWNISALFIFPFQTRPVEIEKKPSGKKLHYKLYEELKQQLKLENLQ